MKDVKNSKEVIAEILNIEDWSSFEEFIYEVYNQNCESIEIIKNYRSNGKSGRLREVDVFIKFGFVPHIISLGIECKFWADKVDGDVVDVVKAKKDDLGINKFAIITTIGYVKGAKQYAASQGIDIFVIRPTVDDDFGYSGKIIKFRFRSYYSSVDKLGVGGQLITEATNAKQSQAYVYSRLQNMEYPVENKTLNPIFDLYRFQIEKDDSNSSLIRRKDCIGNMAELVDKQRLKQARNFYENKQFSIKQQLQFKSPSALFMENKIVFEVKVVEFNIRYFYYDWEFELDRGQFHPVVIENIIENKITALKKEKSYKGSTYKMEQPYTFSPVDMSKKPENAIGREGAFGTLLYPYPMDLNKMSKDNDIYELVQVGDKAKWIKLDV